MNIALDSTAGNNTDLWGDDSDDDGSGVHEKSDDGDDYRFDHEVSNGDVYNVDDENSDRDNDGVTTAIMSTMTMTMMTITTTMTLGHLIKKNNTGVNTVLNT